MVLQDCQWQVSAVSFEMDAQAVCALALRECRGCFSLATRSRAYSLNKSRQRGSCFGVVWHEGPPKPTFAPQVAGQCFRRTLRPSCSHLLNPVVLSASIVPTLPPEIFQQDPQDSYGPSYSPPRNPTHATPRQPSRSFSLVASIFTNRRVPCS